MGFGMFLGVIVGAVIGLVLWIVTQNSIFIALGSNTGLCIGLANGLLASDRPND